MPTHLAVFQHKSRPLDGLCAQLRAAGHVVWGGGSLSALSDANDGDDVDIVLLDAHMREAESALESIEADPKFRDAPIMLVASDEKRTELCSRWSSRVDDILVLPVDPCDLKSRVNSLSRIVSMTAECRRRWAALGDFGIAAPTDFAISTKRRELSVMILGEGGDHQVDILKALDGRITASYASSAADAIAHFRQMQVDVIMITSAEPLVEARAVFRVIKSTPAWCDLPIVIIADTPSMPARGAIAFLEEVDFLPPSTHPATIRLRLQTLARQWRLRRQLRGLMVNNLLSPVMDGLTGLFAFSFFHHYVDSSIVEHRRRGAPLAMATIELVGLSKVNEAWGYPMGDRLLADVALAIAGNCRAQDLAARLGGCRFAILLNDTSTSGAAAHCRRLSAILETALNPYCKRPRSDLHITLGISELSDKDVASILIDRASRRVSLEVLSRAS